MRKNFGLDVVRSLAIIFVLIDHSQPFWDRIWPGDFVANVGIVGVELFFVLSGFLLGERLSNLSITGTGVSAQNVREFFWRRWLRTLPAYFAMLLVILLHDGKLDLRFLIFMQAFDPPMMASAFGQSWSLSIEEMFYLFFPLVIYIFGFYYTELKTSKICLISCILIMIFFPLLRYMLCIFGYKY